MLTKKTLSFLLVALGLAGLVAFRRWNRALEAAVALPEPRHVVVRLDNTTARFVPLPVALRKPPPRYWS